MREGFSCCSHSESAAHNPGLLFQSIGNKTDHTNTRSCLHMHAAVCVFYMDASVAALVILSHSACLLAGLFLALLFTSSVRQKKNAHSRR